ncbi:MAG: hypothetical protein JNJ83_14610 [Verrucomicrobiaceae bacterium]|nr:hypothetical protein [Verrucomicrobiaceae bacterium]
MSRFLALLFLAGSLAPALQGQQSVARTWNERLLGAIRLDVPNPPGHARNLHHTAIAMYNAWAAYDSTAVGYIFNEKVSPLPPDIEAARHEAISYAAYRVIRARFLSSVGAATTLPALDNQLVSLGYNVTIAQDAVTNGTSPAEVGRRIGQMILTWGTTDGFSGTTYPQAYNSAVNPNMAVPLPALGTNLAFQINMPLGFGIPTGTNPNFWQPLAMSTSVSQNGLPLPGGPQGFVGVQGLSTKAFALTRSDPTKPWLDPFGGPSKLGTATDAAYKDNFMDVLRKSARLNDQTVIDISPASIGNNPLGEDTGTGFATNPVTSGTYAPNPAKVGDYVRVLAEYWADGPHSETPPGHWHVMANEVADMPALNKRIGGTGPTVTPLEWDVKTYLALSSATHDAACAAWSLKRYYSGTRPITAIRYMCSKGQSSNPAGPSYDVEGIPLETDVVEVITATTAAPGGKHELIWDVANGGQRPGVDYIGMIAVKSWPGEHPSNQPAPSIATNQSMVQWMLGKDWLPFQRKTFNTPAFPGYVSGHSTFSRAAAEVLTLITGSPYFPNGFHHHTVDAESLQIDLGPNDPVDLQWATYYDAADQAGQSRRWGGIHPYEDDFHGRVIGSTAGLSAYQKAQKYWNASIQNEAIQPSVTYDAAGNAVISFPATLGKLYRIQKSTNLSSWSPTGYGIVANRTTESYTDVGPSAGTFYQVIESTPSAARVWNEQLMEAIRLNVPNPPAHARNLFHTAAAMYDAWAAYDPVAVGYMRNEKVSPLPPDVESARHEAVSYAAYRILRARFASGAGSGTTLPALDAQMTQFGYSPSIGQAALTNDPSPAELGKRIGQAILNWGSTDGFSNVNYPQPYNSLVNPNMDYPLSVLGTNLAFQGFMPLGYGIPEETHPNFWQPLDLSTSVAQNGLPLPGGPQTFVGVQGLSTFPFSLTRTDPTKPWLDPFGGPSKLSTPGNPSTTDEDYKQQALGVLRASSQLNDNTLIDISPGAIGNNPLAQDSGTGFPTNPITGGAYAANMVKRGDYSRVLAEFWADGPKSETPPGHWHVLANQISDHPLTQKRIGGTGPVVSDLEWDVKTYFGLSAATHDAACAAWSLKRYYSGPRPITMIRYMGSKGQSSQPAGPSYHTQGLLLEPGVVEVITSASVAAHHAQIWDVALNDYAPGGDYLGQIAVYSWPGEHPSNPPQQLPPVAATHQSTVRWMLAKDWLPFQRKTFNTPAFPGYVSGHSTFSRAAAEALTRHTGTPYFPGGFGYHSFSANSLQMDLGPSTNVQLQWCTYYDAADQAGQSRRFGGIHPSEDDFDGRYIGSIAGVSAYTLAHRYWTGEIMTESVQPQLVMLGGGQVQVRTSARRGLYYQWEYTTDLQTWIPMSGSTQATDTTLTITDTPPANQRRFYRARWVAAP